MMDQMFDAMKRAYVDEHGWDAWVTKLQAETAGALIARANAETRRRMSPDYDALTPHDLQTRITAALNGAAEHD